MPAHDARNIVFCIWLNFNYVQSKLDLTNLVRTANIITLIKMAHQGSHSNVGMPKTYQSDDQKLYNSSEIEAASARHGVNVAGYRTSAIKPPLSNSCVS